MMELGEGLCKLRKMNFEDGPFHMFEKDISGVLDFIYQTQLELAACKSNPKIESYVFLPLFFFKYVPLFFFLCKYVLFIFQIWRYSLTYNDKK